MESFFRKKQVLFPYKNKMPRVHKSVFIADGVKIIGDVEIDENSSIWFNSVIRGDVNYIRIGKMTNIQDMSMLHVTHDTHPLIIGNNVSIAHSVSLHGATIENNCLIGIGAIVLDGALIQKNSFVAAGAVVKENFIVPQATLVAGVPARVIRELSDEEIKGITETAMNYIKYKEIYHTYPK